MIEALLAKLAVDIVVNTGAFDAAMSRVEARFKRLPGTIAGAFGNLANTALAPITTLLNDLTAVWRRSIEIGIGGTAGVLGFAAKEAGDLESALTAIRKVTGYTDADMAKVSDALKTMATDADLAGVSLDELGRIALMGGKLGVGEGSVQGLVDFSKAMAMVAVSVDDLPIDQVAESMGQALQVFQLGTDKALGFASAVDMLADSTSASTSGIFDVTHRLQGAASVLGMTLQQTIALSTAMLKVGIHQEAAGTAMSKILGKMAGESKDFAAALHMDAKAFQDILKSSPVDALKQVIGAMSKLEGTEQFEMLAELGIDGERARSVMLQLGRTMNDIDPLIAKANSEFQDSTHILKSVELNSQTTWSQLTLLWNQLKLLASELGQHLLPIIKGFGSGLRALSEDVKKWLSDHKGTLEGWGAAIADKMKYIGLLFREWPTFLEIGKVMIGEFFNDILETLPKIGKVLVDAFLGLGKMIAQALADGIVSGAGMVGEAILEVLGVGEMKQTKRVKPEDLVPKPGAAAGIFGAFGQNRPETQQKLDELFGRLGIAQQRQDVDQAKGGDWKLRTPMTDLADSMEAMTKAMQNAFGAGGVGGGAGGKFSMGDRESQLAVHYAGLSAVPGLGSVMDAVKKSKEKDVSLTGQSFSLEQFTRRMQEGALKGTDYTKTTAENTGRIVEKLEGLNTTIKNHGMGGGPALAGGPA